MRLLLLLVIMLFLFSESADADCTPGPNLVGPHTRASWVKGGLVYDLGNDSLKTCDGTSWVTLNASSNASSIEPGWPDAIVCPRTDNGSNIFYIANLGTNNEVSYGLPGADWFILFTKSTGLYKAASGSATTYISAAAGHCRHAATTKTSLYASGRAFNFGVGTPP